MIEHQHVPQLGGSLRTLVSHLRGDDAVSRERARSRLVELGKVVTPTMVQLLEDDDDHVRWEAAKTLAGVADPTAALPLIDAMDDPDEDVRWVASEALVTIGFESLRPLLSALIVRNDSAQFYRSAHHALSRLADRQRSRELQRVVDALEEEQPALHVPGAAAAALERLHLL